MYIVGNSLKIVFSLHPNKSVAECADNDEIFSRLCWSNLAQRNAYCHNMTQALMQQKYSK